MPSDKTTARSAAATTNTNNGKKRKVWARTMNLSTANSGGPSNDKTQTAAVKITSKNMGERAVNITEPNGGSRTVNITTNISNSTQDSARACSGGKRTIGRGGTEVKISFGPSRPPTTSSSNGAGRSKNSNHQRFASHLPPSAAAAASMAAMMGAGDGNISFGNLDLEALKERAAAVAAGQKTFQSKNGLPCTEDEMKALMSMFVEIMGMSMNNKSKGANKSGTSPFGTGTVIYSNCEDGDINQSSNGKKGGGGPVFSFGASPMDAAAAASCGMIPDHMAEATAGFFADGVPWEALRRTYAAAEQMAAAEDDDDDDESFENRELTFEELEFLLQHRKQKEEAAKLASQFASGDWESLEQVAINDHLLSEAEDKERKAAKKREKKQRRKAKLKEEAAQKAAEAAQKKREKAIISWRSRVVSACQSNDVTKLDGLLNESPLRKLMEEDRSNQENSGEPSTACILSHLEFFLPNSVAKNRSQVERGIEARLRLAEYILSIELPLAFKPLRTGRTALHTACFHGDVRFLELLLSKIESYQPSKEDAPLPESILDFTCDESGWSPLHYASLSGSSETMELLLARGCKLSTHTDVTHTWRESDGLGLTPRELVQCVQGGNYEEIIETHGLALQEMTNAFFNHHQERRIFMMKLDRVHHRLSMVEKNGYTPLPKIKSDSVIDSELQTEDAALNRPETSSSRTKKKKKKKKKNSNKVEESKMAPNAGESPTTSLAANLNTIESKNGNDPLVTALLGMGFNKEQITAAVEACGGTHRATADDLVTWILGQGENDESPKESENTPETREKMQKQTFETKKPRSEHTKESVEHNSRQLQLNTARQKEETARRLAAKREEARRRNREWNNREQARQEKEAQAKVAQKLYSTSRPAIPVRISPPGLALQQSKHNGSAHMVNGINSLHTPGNTITGMKPSTRHSQSGNKWGVPPVATQSQSLSRPTIQSTMTSHAAGSPTQTQSTTNELQTLPVSSFIASNNDDDRTVSSLGSSRCVSVSSKEFVPQASNPSNPPPGFTTNIIQPIGVPVRPPVATVQEHPSPVQILEKPRGGEIRATAKEFVPSFTLPDNGNSAESLPNAISASNRSSLQNGQPYEVGLSLGVLSRQGGSTVSQNPLLSSSLPDSLRNSVDNASSLETNEPGTSLIVGSKAEEQAIAIPFGLGLDSSNNESSGIGGSRLLNTISNNQSIGSSSIWGDGQRIPVLDTNLQSSFFGDGNITGLNDDKNTPSWDIPISGNSLLPNNGGQGSIW